jgi:Polysaccharide lyase
MHVLAMLLGLMQPQVTAASSTGTLWQIGDPAITANTGQCGAATHPTATSAEFVLVKNAGCMRNQLNPIGNGGSGVFLLDAGQTYTWSFQTVTHMGIDVGKYTQRLVWQIHDYACGLSPITVLGIQNLAGGENGQTWYLGSGNGTETLPYVEGATDTWKITVLISSTGTGHIQAWHNGTQFADGSGKTFTCGAKPWFNFGPYMWNWTNGNTVSSLAQVEIRFNYMRLTSP